jgi:serine/threonine protein kinase
MGIVYKAEDTKLDRTVALKLLPPHALVSEDDKARFYREARSAAALNHPNIAHVYEIDEAEVTSGDVRPFIAMEFIDGETLADRVARGPLPLKDVVSIATQMAEGLKAAHKKDVVHRDVKSGNIMLTKDGVVKVLDFGLAKTTASTKLTQMGSTLGTVAYMSPEQAKGEEVDRRSDIWSLGVILYEMITGQLPFRGDYEQAVVYGILNEDPESMTTLRAGVPMALDGIIGKLLAKDPDLRYQNVDELPSDLKRIDVSASQTTRISTGSRSVIASAAAIPVVESAIPQQAAGKPWYKEPVALIALVIAAVAGVAGGMLLSGPTQEVESLVRRLDVPNDHITDPSQLAMSPSGEYLAFTGRDSTTGDQGIFLFHAPSREINRIPGTGLGRRLNFSPDNRWLLYSESGGVFKVLVPNGDPIQLTSDPSWSAWESEATILTDDDNKIWRLPADGGERALVAEPDSGRGHDDLNLESVIPDTRFAFVAAEREESEDLAILDLDSGSYHVLVADASDGRYVPGDYIVYIRGGARTGQVVVQPFDPARGRVTGQAVPVAIGERGSWTFNVGQDGSLVYTDEAATAPEVRLSWLATQDGKETEIPIDPGPFDNPMISPDGTRLAIQRENEAEGQQDIYVYDIANGTPLRLSFGGFRHWPSWSPDGRYVYYCGPHSGGHAVYRKAADGTGTEEVVRVGHHEPAISTDGRFMLANAREGDGNGFGIWMTNLSDSTSRLVAGGTGRQQDPSFSPDGRFVVYESNQGGEYQIFVHEVDGDAFWEVSEGPGPFYDPLWSADGRYIYFEEPSSSALSRVAVEVDPSFRRLGRPDRVGRVASTRDFALDPQGRVLVTGGTESQSGNPINPIRIVLNWPEELKRIAPRSEG